MLQQFSIDPAAEITSWHVDARLELLVFFAFLLYSRSNQICSERLRPIARVTRMPSVDKGIALLHYLSPRLVVCERPNFGGNGANVPTQSSHGSGRGSADTAPLTGRALAVC